VVTAPDSPFKTMQDVIDAARSAPRKVTFASAGDGTTSHMAGALLSSLANIELVHTPYKNGSQAMVDTSAGQVQFAFSGPAALPLVKGGKLRVLATTGAQRSALMPDVPTVREATRLDSYEVIGPIWAFAPKGTPAAIVTKLSEAFRMLTASAEYKQFCALQSLDPDYESSEQVKAGQAKELARWRTLVQLTRS
jgi:tripartite-type tricarboxylate transporter receptor subunit TctC